MRTMQLLLLLVILAGVANAQQNPPPDQDKRSEDVVNRGEHVMGFSHEGGHSLREAGILEQPGTNGRETHIGLHFLFSFLLLTCNRCYSLISLL